MATEQRTRSERDYLADGRQQVTNSPVHTGCGLRHEPLTPCPTEDLTNEALRLAALADNLAHAVTGTVDRIAALHARTAARELETLADIMEGAA